jgi:hypothetical protein
VLRLQVTASDKYSSSGGSAVARQAARLVVFRATYGTTFSEQNPIFADATSRRVASARQGIAPRMAAVHASGSIIRARARAVSSSIIVPFI